MTAIRPTMLALLILALGERGAEELAFRPAAGTTLVRTLESEYRVALQETVVTMNGEVIPAELLPRFDLTIEHRERTRVTDVFEALGSGRPLRLRRTFDEIAGDESTRVASDEGEETHANRYASALEGRSVVFVWNEESHALEPSFADGKGAEGPSLAKLEEDMDLRAFLPARAVTPGARWEIDVKAFQAVLDPGGDLALRRVAEDAADTSAQDQELRDNLLGTLAATFQGMREEDGAPAAVVALELDARTHTDQAITADERGEAEQGTRRTEVAFRLRGELLWDCVHGHARRLELRGDNEVVLREERRGAEEGEPFVQVQTVTCRGAARYSMRFERR